MNTSAEVASGSSLDSSSGSESLSSSSSTTRNLISELKELILPKANATNKGKGKARVLASDEALKELIEKEKKKEDKKAKQKKQEERERKRHKKKRLGRKD